MQKNKILFFGTPEIAKRTLEGLIDANFEILGVVTKIDKPIGRKKEIIFNPVKQLAIEKNIPVYQFEKMKDLYQEIKNLPIDLIVTCAFGKIITDEILNLPKYKAINFHTSLLPKYRGGAPIHYAILHNEKETGLSLMYMVKQMDAGDVIKQVKVNIDEHETYRSLYDKLKEVCYHSAKNDIINCFQLDVKANKQDESLVSFAYNITREQEKIDFNQSIEKIDCQIRGLYDQPMAYLLLDDQEIKVHSAKKTLIKSTDKPGVIEKVNKEGIFINTKDYLICLTKVQLPSKKPLMVNQIINGKHPFIIKKTCQ